MKLYSLIITAFICLVSNVTCSQNTVKLKAENIGKSINLFSDDQIIIDKDLYNKGVFLNSDKKITGLNSHIAFENNFIIYVKNNNLQITEKDNSLLSLTHKQKIEIKSSDDKKWNLIYYDREILNKERNKFPNIEDDNSVKTPTNNKKTEDSQVVLSKKEFKPGENILNDAKILINEFNDPKTVKIPIIEMYKASASDVFFKDNIGVNAKDKSGSTFKLNQNIAKTDVTNFATGMARFLAERAKAELNETFFLQMRKQMEKTPELQVYFPESYLFLKRIDAHSMSFDVEHLKSKFEKDINLLPRNILNTISIADDTKYPHFKTANNYLNNNVNGLWMNVALHSALESNGKINPKEFLFQFVHAKNTNNEALLLKLEAKLCSYDDQKQVNLINSIKLAELVSNSLLSPETGKYWVSSEEINDLINNEKLFQTYIGLLLAKSNFKEYKIMFNNKSLESFVLSKYTKGGQVNGDLSNLKKIITDIHQTYQNIEDQVDIVKTTNNERELAERSYQVFDVVKTSVYTIQNLISRNDYLGENIIINTEVFNNYIDPSVEIAYNLFNKKYNLAIKNFIVILNQVPTTSKFVSGYDLLNLVETVNIEKMDIIKVNTLLIPILKQDSLKKSLIEHGVFTADDLNGFIQNEFIPKEYLNKIILDKNNPIYTYLNEEGLINKNHILLKFLEQENIQQSLIDAGIFNKEDLEKILETNYISEHDLAKLIFERDSEIYAYLIKQKYFDSYFRNKNQDYNKFVSKFTIYGTLIANVSMAQNSDEVKNAIASSVLPVGSSRMKRHSDWSITVNAFVGGFVGKAFYKDFNGIGYDNKSVTSFGVTAPIGISFNKGRMPFFGSKSTLGLTLQLIDLGSLVNFYAQKGDGAALPRNTKIELGDIIAPGGLLSYSLGDSPFTLLGGVQYVPNLSRMETIATNAEFKPLTWRFHVGLAIDIPLFNLRVWN